MKSIVPLLVLIAAVAVVAQGQLLISEYIEGSSSNKALEIYNAGNTSVDLETVMMYRYNNGSLTPTDSLFFDWPGGTKTLDSKEVFVIANPSAVAAILAASDTTHTMTFYNGDDALELRENGVAVDRIGEIGVDPGSGWAVGTGATNNFTLIRKFDVCEGELNWTVGVTEWDVFPIDMLDSIGAHYAPCPASIGPGQLLISNYIEGSSSNKALEVYNAGGNTVDLETVMMYRYNNGSLTPTDSLFFDWPGGSKTLASGEVFIIANPSANAAILAAADTTHTMTFYNGDDALELRESGAVVDRIGEIGVDPGSGWPVGTGATNNFTLIRKYDVCYGQLDWNIGATEWDVYPIDMVDSLGAHNTSCPLPVNLQFFEIE